MSGAAGLSSPNTHDNWRSGAKLPRVCKELGVRHVLIGGKLNSLPQFEKARAVVSVWSDLVEAVADPHGSGAFHSTVVILIHYVSPLFTGRNRYENTT